MSIITYNQLLNTATRSREYSDDIGAALYSYADDAYAQANSAYSMANAAYKLASTASNAALYGSYDSTDESITLSIG